jgi:hypothetical protein
MIPEPWISSPCLNCGGGDSAPNPAYVEYLEAEVRKLASDVAWFKREDERLKAEVERLKGEMENVTNWNMRVSVCRKHTPDIVDGECVLCENARLTARVKELEEALRWRKYPEEKPEEGVRYNVRLAGDMNEPLSLVYHAESPYWGKRVVLWLPIPPDKLQEEKK